MLEAGTLYSFYLCDWHVSVEWSPAAKASYEVRVMVHDPSAPLHGSDVAVGLLDAVSRPLPRLNPEADHAAMLSVVWAGQETQHKWARFGRGEGEPSLLEIVIRGHRAAIPLAGGRKGKARAKGAGYAPKRGDDKRAGDDRRGGGDKDGGRGNGDQDGGRNRDRKAQPKCCVENFATPNGALPTTPIANPGGGSSFQCRPWVVIAMFGNTAPCQCTCCEYRQYVKGTMTATPPGGAAGDISPITDYQIPAGPPLPGAPPPAPLPVQGLNPNGFIEDSVGRPDQPGNPSRYGPRDQAGDGTQDYPWPCFYWGLDRPGVYGAAAGTRIDVDVIFNGEIRDVCRDEVSRGPNEWSWKFSQVA